MATTSSKNQVRENFVLSVWPNSNHLATIDPTCLAASLWLRAQGLSYSIVNANRQISMIFDTYPMLHDVANRKHYVGFESIYEYSRTLHPTADELALLATFKRLFVPAFMHSQWLDETNKASVRALYHHTIGLPTSLFYIRKKFSSAQTWLEIIASKLLHSNEQHNAIYDDAERCFSILENKLIENNQPFIGGEKFSLIDAWVSSYLLVLVHYASEKSRLRTLFIQHSRLIEYIQRIDEEQLSLYKERENYDLQSASSEENSTDLLSVLHIISQVVSFSIFILMLTKIGAKSYSITA
ncbi:unnamed protein product [Rotaria magnacalcarata]|uniref:Metaxin n=3 Tax=Rotaria magnacalcarata TaxID=392030 RepID=A0A814XI21_9BILA|nr:unnamed protein product [Rotaria magnacalcarata]CAF1589021.1 unnamed protein product [Rotaria magnacalcarata]CAF2073732.1 unnamed protein product [Rotaria magnacalcarata]CAF2160066.1 unnamed protein product [Rotaria magnacalcarata]CAF3769722.1 unnamed protein product [Rotaria magnacalcarata]